MEKVTELVRGPVGHVALLAFGLAVLGAEVWLIVTGTSLALAFACMLLTLVTLAMLVQEAWEDWR